MTTTYRAGSKWMPGTNLHANVTGECPHRHRTPEAASACIDRTTRAIKSGHGQTAYCDRIVMVEHEGEYDRHPLGVICGECP